METYHRRQFLQLSGTTAAGALLTGCAINPVTGQRQLMLMSEAQEVGLDRQHSKQQFAQDYGALADVSINAYVSKVGLSLSAVSDRPTMPYSFRGVNASYINAYAFPGGSIAVTRGILLKLNDEATLAALLGHEIGHVCARHTAQRMTKGMLVQAGVVGLAYGAHKSGADDEVTAVIGGVGTLGGTVLLAKYSRDDERQADALGMKYAVKAGYTPGGVISLMQVLRSLGRGQPSLMERMFSSHPMSDDRYRDAIARATNEYASAAKAKDGRDEYMAAIKPLREKEKLVTAIQAGDKAMGGKQYQEAYGHYGKALAEDKRDLEALLKMSACCSALGKTADAKRYAETAKAVSPENAKAREVAGILALQGGRYDVAETDFLRYEQLVPGTPGMLFLRGQAAEGAGHRQTAAKFYNGYLQQVKQGSAAEHAYGRMVQWGYVKKQTP